MAIALSWLVICLFLWFRFGSWAYGIAAVLCLIHDVLVAIGMIALSALLFERMRVRRKMEALERQQELDAERARIALVEFRRHSLAAGRECTHVRGR